MNGGSEFVGVAATVGVFVDGMEARAIAEVFVD